MALLQIFQFQSLSKLNFSFDNKYTYTFNLILKNVTPIFFIYIYHAPTQKNNMTHELKGVKFTIISMK
jgi:hypothetical protein